MRPLVCLALISALSFSQTSVYVPDNDPVTGSCNAIPFGTIFASGYTYVGVVPASYLDPANPILDDLAFSPCGTGSWTATDILIGVGHVPALTAPISFPSTTTLGSFLDFSVIWDSSIQGPYVYPATLDTWSPMGFGLLGGTGFVWNGVNDVGIFISYQTGVVSGFTGSFHRTSTDPARYYAAGYLATASTGSGANGLKTRLDFSTGGPVGFSIAVGSPAPGAATLLISNVPSTAFEGWTLISTTTPTPVGAGSVFGITPDAITFIIPSIEPVATPGGILHWTWPASGIFPDVALSLPSGTMSAFSGQTWDFLALSVGTTGLDVSNVSRITW